MEDQAIWEEQCKRFDADYPDAGRAHWTDLAHADWVEFRERLQALYGPMTLEDKRADARMCLVLTAHAWVSAMRGSMPKAAANA